MAVVVDGGASWSLTAADSDVVGAGCPSRRQAPGTPATAQRDMQRQTPKPPGRAAQAAMEAERDRTEQLWRTLIERARGRADKWPCRSTIRRVVRASRRRPRRSGRRWRSATRRSHVWPWWTVRYRPGRVARAETAWSGNAYGTANGPPHGTQPGSAAWSRLRQGNAIQVRDAGRRGSEDSSPSRAIVRAVSVASRTRRLLAAACEDMARSTSGGCRAVSEQTSILRDGPRGGLRTWRSARPAGSLCIPGDRGMRIRVWDPVVGPATLLVQPPQASDTASGRGTTNSIGLQGNVPWELATGDERAAYSTTRSPASARGPGTAPPVLDRPVRTHLALQAVDHLWPGGRVLGSRDGSGTGPGAGRDRRRGGVPAERRLGLLG